VNPKFTEEHTIQKRMLISCKQLNFGSEFKFAADHTTLIGNPKFAAGHTMGQRMLIRCKQLNFDSELQIRFRQFIFGSESQIG
jgi:hypothetical protein